MISLDDFQRGALETAVYPEQHRVIYPALGLAGEAGEVADKVKKVLRGDGPLDEERKKAIAQEIGDVLWYCAVLASDLGFGLEEIGSMNYAKLHSRKERGMLGGDGDDR
jgi:NTP pyrophosphatase (non-canonical NTP hydrolase)